MPKGNRETQIRIQSIGVVKSGGGGRTQQIEEQTLEAELRQHKCRSKTPQGDAQRNKGLRGNFNADNLTEAHILRIRLPHTSSICPQTPALSLKIHKELLADVENEYATDVFTSQLVEWLGGAVRIEVNPHFARTVTYGGIGDVGNDSRTSLDDLATEHPQPEGARHIASYFLSTYGEHYFAMIVDEGAIQFEAFGIEAAALRRAISTIGLLALAVVHPEENPEPAHLTRTFPVYALFQCQTEHSPIEGRHSRESPQRCSSQELIFASELGDLSRLLLRTTQAVNVIGGGVKVNALPELPSIIAPPQTGLSDPNWDRPGFHILNHWCLIGIEDQISKEFGPAC
ncbi:uncharacterized protein EI90DRAFT_3014255 [Cantharellus anzutake]|uniref:uncharacterized protein n=1 Tax=Cantharellus anzutake TaxID=1750568 RepID=UPI0019049E89|nr:uncharacterized protein EI90DRAFT_3014255 [Cantharellus anzutake]KAF8336544.1 hypothetical protein EI90DRAFT_3014255 [Cantharellus anzutake]